MSQGKIAPDIQEKSQEKPGRGLFEVCLRSTRMRPSRLRTLARGRLH